LHSLWTLSQRSRQFLFWKKPIWSPFCLFTSCNTPSFSCSGSRYLSFTQSLRCAVTRTKSLVRMRSSKITLSAMHTSNTFKN
jgi:hypothetical protein